MGPTQYAILGYAVSIILLWGYALSLFLKWRAICRITVKRGAGETI